MNRALAVAVCVGVVPLAGIATAATPFERAEQAEQDLRIHEARDLYRQALEEHPDTPGVAEHAAWFLFLNGFHDEECRDLLRKAAPKGQEPAAMERAARHVERELGLRPPADAEEQEAQRAFHRDRIARAADGTDEQLGGALVDAGDFGRGIPLLEEALATSPANAPLALKLARAYAWSSRLADAEAAYTRLNETHPGNAALLLEAGRVAADLGEIDRAARRLAAAAEARADDPRIGRELARVQAALAARKPADAAVESLPPPPPPIAFKQGEQAENELRIYEARDLFRQALRENPDAPGVAEHAAWFLFLNGFHDEECRDLLRQAAPKAQEPAAMERAARHVERTLGLRPPADEEEKEAKRAFDRAMIEKASKGTAAELGGALVDAGEYANGIPLLEQALAADPANVPLALRIARAYVFARRQAEADAAYGRLLAWQPDNPALLVERAGVAASRGMLDRARNLLTAAERARPGDARILLERSRVEARRTERRAALQAVDRMSPSDQARPAATLARARAEHSRASSGRPATAICGPWRPRPTSRRPRSASLSAGCAAEKWAPPTGCSGPGCRWSGPSTGGRGPTCSRNSPTRGSARSSPPTPTRCPISSTASGSTPDTTPCRKPRSAPRSSTRCSRSRASRASTGRARSSTWLRGLRTRSP